MASDVDFARCSDPQHKGLLERDGRKTLGEIVSMAFIPAVCFISVSPMRMHAENVTSKTNRKRSC